MRFVLACCCALWFSGATAQRVSAQPRHPRLGAGDVVEIKVKRYRELSGDFVLDETGHVRFRIAGEIKLSGQTINQARRTLAIKLSVHFRKLQSLQIRLKAKKKYIWVRGWVKRPGRYHLRWNEGLEVALQKAGGFRRGANAKEVWYYRKGSSPRRVNMYRYYLSKGKMSLPPMGRNVTIFAVIHPSQGTKLLGMSPSLQPKAPFVAVFGAVRRPGLYPCTKGMKPLQALALAGGPMPKAALQEVLLLQKGTTSWFDLRRWIQQRHMSKQPQMSAGAILYIPYRVLGLSQRGPIELFGAVRRPGVLHAPLVKSLSQLLASRGGARSDADLSKLVVTTKGTNFTIKQTVNVTQIMQKGHLRRLPPIQPRPTIVFVPKKPGSNQQLADAQNITQIVVAAASVVTSIVLIVVTVNATRTP